MYSAVVLFTLDSTTDESIFAQLTAQVRRATAHGDLRVGDRLPPARETAESLGINVHTVLRAYHELRDEGLVDLRRGRGATITAIPVQADATLQSALDDVVTAAQRLGISPRSTLALLEEALR